MAWSQKDAFITIALLIGVFLIINGIQHKTLDVPGIQATQASLSLPGDLQPREGTFTNKVDVVCTSSVSNAIYVLEAKFTGDADFINTKESPDGKFTLDTTKALSGEFDLRCKVKRLEGNETQESDYINPPSYLRITHNTVTVPPPDLSPLYKDVDSKIKETIADSVFQIRGTQK